MDSRIAHLGFGLVLASALLIPATSFAATLSVPSASYPTIQSAINAAQSGDTVSVAAGTYHESLSVVGKTNVTIQGAGTGKNTGTFIIPVSLVNTGVGHKYTSDMLASVFVNQSSGVTLKAMAVEDNGQAPGFGGPDALIFWNASSGTIQGLKIQGTYTINGDQTGQGIAVDAGSGQVTDLTVKSTTIQGFQKNAIDAIDGNSLTSNAGVIHVTVNSGTITGAGATSTIAQNGILVWNRGGGTVSGSVNGTNISNLEYTGAGGPEDVGIYAYGTATMSPVSNVTFKNTDYYISSASSGTPIDATGNNMFDGVTVPGATTAQLGTIENKLYGEMETAGVDPIFILPHTWIVTTATANLGIQTAINDATAGDTVLVTPGAYSGNFTVNKSITLDGAQYSNAVSGRTFNSANESTISGAAEGTGVITITAAGVVVDGFSITDVQPLFSALGLVIKNGGDNATVQNNIFDDITTADTGGNGTAQAVYFEGAVNGDQVLNNLMTDIHSNLSAKGVLFGDNGGSDNATNATIEGNTISNVTSDIKGAYGISFGNTTNPQSGITLKNNVITGLNGGGWAHGIGVEGNAPSIDIEGNTFSSFTSPAPIAIWFESEDTSFTSATVKNNDLGLTSSQIGVGEQLTGGTLDAENNWWGDLTGPTDTVSGDGSIPDTNPHGIGSVALGAVKYDDWCVDSSCADFSDVTVPTPTPVSPADAAVVTTVGLTSVNWSSVTDAFTPITYFYEISNSSATNPDGSFVTPVYQSGALTANSIATPGTPEGTYYWHVYAEDYLGNKSSWSTTSSFTVDNTPSVVTNDATSIDDTDATLNGAVGPIDADNTSFWWGTTDAGPFSAGAAPVPPAGWQHDSGLGATSANGTFNEPLTNLVPGTTYYFVAWIEVGGTWYPGAIDQFTTTGVAPVASVTTNTASSVDTTDATLNGMNGAIAADNTSFWWGTTSATSFTSAADPRSELPSGWSHDSGLGTAGVNGSFNEPLTGLASNTEYYFAAWSLVGGVWYPGSVLNFTTENPAPSVATDAATSITSSDATLEGTNGPLDADQVSFWISTTPGIDTSNPNSIPSGVVSTPVTNTVAANADFSDQLSLATTNGVPSDLPTIQPNTPYYYVAWAYIGGTWYHGTEQSFTTASGPAVPVPGVMTEAASNLSDSDATLNGLNGDVAADDESFWVSTSSIDFSDANNIPDGVYSTPVLTGGVAADTGFTDDLAIVTTNGIINGGANVNMLPITPDTVYYYVAWANIGGTWYNGGQQSFETSDAPPTPPTAVDDTATTDIGTQVSIDVLANDSDATDIASLTQPTDGQVATSGTEVIYTPNADFAGDDSFTYVASGPGGTSNSATVNISVIDNTTPVLTVNGDNPTYVETDSTYSDPGVTVTDTPTDGLDYSVTLDGVATSTDFTLDTSVSGTHTVVYSATDGGGNTGYATRTIEVLDAPTVTLTSTSTSPTTDNPIHVVADFSEPVTSFDEGDIDLSSDSLENFAQASTTEYSFDLIPNGANISATIDEHKFENLAGAQNDTGASISFVYSPLEAPSDTSDTSGTGGGGDGNGNNGALGVPDTFGSTGGTVNGQVLGAQAYNFDTNLYFGMHGQAVSELQQLLITDGYSIPDGVTQYFGPETLAAVKKYQTAHGIPSTGFVGPLTRAALNADPNN